jgi:hypothetical protein
VVDVIVVTHVVAQLYPAVTHADAHHLAVTHVDVNLHVVIHAVTVVIHAVIHVIVVIVAVILLHSHASDKEKAQDLKLKIFAKHVPVLKVHQILELIALINAATIHVDQTVAQAVEVAKRQENSTLMVALLYVKASALMNAIHAKHVEKDAHNAQMHALTHAVTIVVNQSVAHAIHAVVVAHAVHAAIAVMEELQL